MIETCIRICLVLTLIKMGSQDFKYRGITWYFFPILAMLLWFSNVNFTFMNFMVNVGFLTFVYLLLSTWFSIKEKTLINLSIGYLGAGDLLFFLCLSIYFPPINFFFFYGFSLLIISVIYGLYFLLMKPRNNSIPLAGMQGVIMVFTLVTSWCLKIDLSDECLLENYFELVTPIF